MGTFFTGCRVVNCGDAKRSVVIPKLMVDTGAEATWINAALLENIGIEPRKKDLTFQMANGQLITRSVGFAILKVNQTETVDEVVFAQPGDLRLLGARALAGLNLKVDSRNKKLVAAGPIIAATAVPPRLGNLVQVPSRTRRSTRKSVRPSGVRRRVVSKLKH